LEIPVLPSNAVTVLLRIPLFLVLCASLGLSQKRQPGDSSLPKYDLDTEMKTKGVIDEVNLLCVGNRKDFAE
jgi:hypothetical protein